MNNLERLTSFLDRVYLYTRWTVSFATVKKLTGMRLSRVLPKLAVHQLSILTNRGGRIPPNTPQKIKEIYNLRFPEGPEKVL